VTDPTQRGIVAAERIASLRNELDIEVGFTGLILNRLMGDIPAPLIARIESLDIPLIGVIPADEELTLFEFDGRPLVDLGIESPVYQAVAGMMGEIGI
jgi:CO dehydrogenase maturation factor